MKLSVIITGGSSPWKDVSYLTVRIGGFKSDEPEKGKPCMSNFQLHPLSSPQWPASLCVEHSHMPVLVHSRFMYFQLTNSPTSWHIEPGGSIPHSQVLRNTSNAYPEPYQFNSTY